jgi:hypothetical protein
MWEVGLVKGESGRISLQQFVRFLVTTEDAQRNALLFLN